MVSRLIRIPVIVNRIANRSMSSTVKQISVEDFSKIVHHAKIQARSEAGVAGAGSRVQIIDVRESNELSLASLPEGIFTHLPLQNSHVWAQDVVSGKLLDSSVATYCLCHHGMRSQKVAQFLGIR